MRPPGRPKKIITTADKLAKMTKAERAQLLAYQAEVDAVKANKPLQHGDIGEDGRVFICWKPVWYSQAQYKRWRKTIAEWQATNRTGTPPKHHDQVEELQLKELEQQESQEILPVKS